MGFKVKQSKISFLILLGLIIIGLGSSIIVNLIRIKQKKHQPQLKVTKFEEFETTSLEQLNQMIDNQEKIVVYIGYTGCQACEEHSFYLHRVQKQQKLKIYYLDYQTINRKSKQWVKLLKRVKIKQYLVLKIKNREVKIDDTVGNIIRKYGYTPATILFENGVCTQAIIGQLAEDQLNKMLK